MNWFKHILFEKIHITFQYIWINRRMKKRIRTKAELIEFFSLGSDWADAQADLGLQWKQSPKSIILSCSISYSISFILTIFTTLKASGTSAGVNGRNPGVLGFCKYNVTHNYSDIQEVTVTTETLNFNWH